MQVLPGKKRQFTQYIDELDLTAPSENSKKISKPKKIILRNRNAKILSFPLLSDFTIGLGGIKHVPDNEFDQDVDTDQEALEGSIRHMEENFKSSMREFISIPLALSKKMLKNSEIGFRIARPDDYYTATG